MSGMSSLGTACTTPDNDFITINLAGLSLCAFSRRDQMRAARSVESLDTTGRPGPHANLVRSFDDQQLHDALSEQRVGPGPPTSRRQPPGQYASSPHSFLTIIIIIIIIII